jgi:hypothetical protein
MGMDVIKVEMMMRRSPFAEDPCQKGIRDEKPNVTLVSKRCRSKELPT